MNPQIYKNGRVVLAVAAAFVLAGCASTPEPKTEMAVAQAAVDTASGNSAEAPAELSTAKDKLARANVALARKDYEQARRLADEAAADAALAQATARSARSGRALAEVRESIQQLRMQLTRP